MKRGRWKKKAPSASVHVCVCVSMCRLAEEDIPPGTRPDFIPSDHVHPLFISPTHSPRCHNMIHSCPPPLLPSSFPIPSSQHHLSPNGPTTSTFGRLPDCWWGPLSRSWQWLNLIWQRRLTLQVGSTATGVYAKKKKMCIIMLHTLQWMKQPCSQTTNNSR